MTRLWALFAAVVCSVAALMPSVARADNSVDRISVGSNVHVGADEDLPGSVVVVGGDAVVNGRVRGDVVVVGGTLRLGPGAIVDGDKVHIVGRLEQNEAARIAGVDVELGDLGDGAGQLTGDVGAGAVSTGGTAVSIGVGDEDDEASGPSTWLVISLGAWTLGTSFLLVLGTLFLSVWPERSRNLRRTVEAAPVTAFGMGLLGSLGLGLLAILLTASGVGMLALPFLSVVALTLWLTGLTGLLEAVGDRLPLPSSMRSRGTTFVAGCLAVSAVALLAATGWVAALFVWLVLATLGCTAIGAVLLSGLGRAPWAPRA